MIMSMRNHTTDERTQNVHDTTRIIQYQVNVGHILAMMPPHFTYTASDTYKEVKAVYLRQKSSSFKLLYARVVGSNFLFILKRWLRGEASDRLYDLTFCDLFARIWFLVSKQNRQKEFLKRFKLELDDSFMANVCFTGRVLRVINAVVGILPEIHLGLTVNEQLNNHAIHLWRALTKQKLSNEIFQEKWQESITELLDSYGVDDTNLREAYLTFEAEERVANYIETFV